jgi:DNA invertase Pin-like site-specific DNA recombinase
VVGRPDRGGKKPATKHAFLQITTTGRDEFRIALDILRKGDVLMVTRIDRLARSIGDLQDIVRAVKAKGVAKNR